MFGHIVLKQRNAEENDHQDGDDIPFQTIVQRGELLSEIPQKDQVPRKDGKPSHNYHLHNDPAITLYDDGTGVCPLQGAELDYLQAIENPTTRIVQYLEADKMKWIIDLKTNDVVFFRLKLAKEAPPVVVKGRIRYYGLIKGHVGVMFGIEILDPHHKGKGNNDGTPHFRCDHNNGIFVAMDQIVKVVKSDKNAPVPPTSGKNSPVIDEQPRKTGPSGPSTGTRSKTGQSEKDEKDKGFLDKARNKVKEAFQPSSMVRPDLSSTVHSKFTIGDNVVLQPVNSAIIKGIVRWTGPVRTSKDTGGLVIPIVGVETYRTFDHEKCFPGLSYGVTGHDLFQVPSKHGRIFLAEQIVLTDEEYLQQKKQDNTDETREAKKWGVSVEELKLQEELLSKGNQERDREHEYRRDTHPDPASNEEDMTTGARGDRRRGSQDLRQQVQNRESSPIGPEGTINLREESIRNQQMEYQRLQNQFHRQNSHDDNKPPEGYNNSYPPSDYQLAPSLEQPNQRLSDQDVMKGIQSNLDTVGHGDQPPRSSDPSPRNSPHSNRGSNINNINNQQHFSNNNQQHFSNNNQQYYNQSSSYQGDGNNFRQPLIPSDPSLFTVGTMVQVQMMNAPPLHGIIKWMGTLPSHEGYYTGVELDDPFANCSDGTFGQQRYFDCPPSRALFCLASALQLDPRYIEPNQIPAAKRQDMTNPLAEKIPQYDESDPYVGPELFSKYIGNEHGIQGHHNSCYLDATVFGLFALSDSFDDMLLEEPQTDIGKKIKRILWKGVVNPLRRYGVARYESIMELRNELEYLGKMKGANKDEKDPEEFLNLLLKDILHVEPFISIKRPFGVEKEFFVQLFLEIEPNQTAPPTTEKLITKMFHEQNISFTAVPSKLLLQMPRFGKDFKMFNKIIPSLKLDVLPVIDPTSRGVQQCIVCKEVTATVCCSDCSSSVFKTKDTSVFLCKKCSQIVHEKRQEHKHQEVQTKRPMSDVSKFSKMELLSVICIETSHYVCFTRKNNRWLFHDSMADRVYDTYNIPRVTEVSNELNHWVYNPDNHQKLLQTPSREIPECVRRFTQDIYMCVYINPHLDRYQCDVSPPYDNSLSNSPDHDYDIVENEHSNGSYSTPV